MPLVPPKKVVLDLPQNIDPNNGLTFSQNLERDDDHELEPKLGLSIGMDAQGNMEYLIKDDQVPNFTMEDLISMQEGEQPLTQAVATDLPKDLPKETEEPVASTKVKLNYEVTPVVTQEQDRVADLNSALSMRMMSAKELQLNRIRNFTLPNIVEDNQPALWKVIGFDNRHGGLEAHLPTKLPVVATTNHLKNIDVENIDFSEMLREIIVRKYYTVKTDEVEVWLLKLKENILNQDTDVFDSWEAVNNYLSAQWRMTSELRKVCNDVVSEVMRDFRAIHSAYKTHDLKTLAIIKLSNSGQAMKEKRLLSYTTTLCGKLFGLKFIGEL